MIPNAAKVRGADVGGNFWEVYTVISSKKLGEEISSGYMEDKKKYGCKTSLRR